MAEIDEGSVIGNYRVIRLLGQGGMGTVYEVEHLELGTRYALKTFTFDPDNDANHALRKKFLEEGKLLARLRHPNLTHVFDLGFEEKTQMPYFVMDLVVYSDGETYTVEDIELGDITEEMVYKWFRQLASALDYIHGEGIVHRDIKPSNLLVDKDLNVVLTDFGISRIFGQKIKSEVEATRTVVTKTGRGKLVLGTEHYIAPEVAEGEEATPKADAYSLGVMLLRWLTGFYYGDNPGAVALLAHKKYNWLGVIPRLLAPAGRRPENYTELVKMVKPAAKPAPAPKPQGVRDGGRAREVAIGVAAGLLAVVVLCVAGYSVWRYVEKKNAEHDRQMAALAQQIRDREEADRKAKAEAEAAKKAKEAEEKRVAEEKKERERKAREAKLAEQKRIEESRTKIEKQDVSQLAVRETPVSEVKKETTEPEPEKAKPKEEFVVVKEETPAEEVKDYGPIPDKKYAWLKGGNAKLPQEVKFQLANGDEINMLPMKAGIFFMTNDKKSEKAYHKVTITRPFWVSKYCVSTAQWREFDDPAVSDCIQLERILGKSHPISKRVTRKQMDAFCDYLSKRYNSQLPRGYVFRLPTEAEWEYVLDLKGTIKMYGDGALWGNVLYQGGIAVSTLKALLKNPELKRLFERNDGFYNNGWDNKKGDLFIGGLSKPNASGILDPMQPTALLLDTFLNDKKVSYGDEEVDPLFWVESSNIYRPDIFSLARRWWADRVYSDINGEWISHIVVGPDLVKEKAWKNRPQEQASILPVKVPNQKCDFNPAKVPNKISKPKIVKMKMACGETMEFCTVPKAKFYMTNPKGQDKSCHKVELTRPFWMTKYCVTAKQLREFAKYDCEYDFRMVEKLFAKYPVSPARTKDQWLGFCRYMNENYSSLIPSGYVFRLPTEAEWEWAFIADKDKDAARMDHLKYDPWAGENQEAFKALLQKLKVPKGLEFRPAGDIVHEIFVGGRFSSNAFGLYDLCCPNDALVFDEYDAGGATSPDGSFDWHYCRNHVDPYMVYDKEEIDPVHWDGLRNERLVGRSFEKRFLWDREHRFFAHIVIAPELDIERRVKEDDLKPYPKNAFGGELLADCVKVTDISSRHSDASYNTEERWKFVVSPEPVLYQEFVEGKNMSACHTRRERSPWIQLTFDSQVTITGIQIESTRNTHWLEHLRIWCSDDGKRWKEIGKDDRVMHRYIFDLQGRNVKAKYIRVGREQGFKEGDFSLSKILIYGKK